MPDYFAPAFQVQINGTSLAADISKNISQVSVISQSDTMDNFNFTMVNQYPRLRWTHTSDAQLFQQGGTVTISMGYGSADDLQPMIEGIITKLSPTFPESGTPTVRVEGHTKMHQLQGSKTTRTFQQMTDTQIVTQIAEKAGLAVQADDTQVSYDYVIQANQTDLEFIKARAARIHFELVVKGPTLIFRKANEASTKIYTLVWGNTQEGLASGPNTLPLKSFTPSMNALQPPTSVEVRGYDVKNKTEFVGSANAGSEDTDMAGSKTGSQVAGTLQTPRKFVRVSIPVASQAEADQHAKAILNNLAMSLVTGDASTIGIPDLRCGSVVEFKGLGPVFSGLYYIDNATHTIDGGGYKTDISVKRNAI